MPPEEFEKLHEWVRKKIKNVAILVEDEPSEEEREVCSREAERYPRNGNIGHIPDFDIVGEERR